MVFAIATDSPLRARLVRRSWVAGYDDGARRRHWSDLAAALALLPRWSLSSAVGVRTEDRVLALTFDDGPDPQSTPPVLAALAERRARATFFMLAERAQTHPAVVRQVLAGGHEIGLHGIDHTRMTGMDAERFRRELSRGREMLEAVTGCPVTLYRPTYGDFTGEQVALVKDLGLEPVIWSAWARDWEADPPAEITARALRAIHPGAIMLLHDAIADRDMTGRDHDCASWTAGLLDGLGPGWRPLTVTRLLADYPQIRCPWFAEPAAKADFT